MPGASQTALPMSIKGFMTFIIWWSSPRFLPLMLGKDRGWKDREKKKKSRKIVRLTSSDTDFQSNVLYKRQREECAPRRGARRSREKFAGREDAFVGRRTQTGFDDQDGEARCHGLGESKRLKFFIARRKRGFGERARERTWGMGKGELRPAVGQLA
ncbi:hypothetical protein LZ32DRAFT_74984 [Colletotrichum eremochloae]|nr:hypothetical protein LZ32DRAFT_74984 [Colletotrichum eremochloae]